jgi:hypothetical protein
MSDELTPSPLFIMGPKVLLEGPAGTGKTYALGTLADWAQANGKEMFVLFVENGLETLLGYWRDRGLEIPPCLHWHSAMTRPMGLKSLMKAANDVGRLSYQALASTIDPDRGGANNSFHKLLTACSDFPDDRTGQKFGALDSWTADRIVAIDSLSELSNSSMKMVVGNKPMASQPDYGVAQSNLMNFLRLLTQGIACPLALTAHVSREVDELTGISKIMTKAIGKALAGEIPQLFSDVILTVREADRFYWDTAASNADVKSRSLPIKSKQAPDFSIIMNKWLHRMEVKA